MMIKVGNEFLDFDGDIPIERQIFDYSSLSIAGSYSYSLTIPPTTENKKKLGIVDQCDINTQSVVSDVIIATDSGTELHHGYIVIENPIGIDLSFFGESFIPEINGKVRDLDFSELNVIINEDAITNSWSSDTGIVFPLIDRGALLNRKDAFMKLRVRRGRVDQNDWQPFIFIKDILNKILLSSNLKISGDLVKDPVYNTLITTNNDITIKNKILYTINIYVGTDQQQTIPHRNIGDDDTTPGASVKIQFNLTDGEFFNSDLLSFDVANSRWTVKYDCLVELKFHMVVDDSSKEVHWQLRQNGTDVQDIVTKSNSVELKFSTGSFDIHAEAGDYFELWAYVYNTSGTADVISGSFKTKVISSNTCFGNTIVPDMESIDFVSSVFKMFNVIADYNKYTRTIETTFFENINYKDEQDLSDYFLSIKDSRNIDLISGMYQNNILGYEDMDSADITEYNESNTIKFGSGQINIDNDFLDKTGDFLTIPFKAPFVYKNNVFGLYLIKLNYVEYNSVEGSLNESVDSVTDDSGLAKFAWSDFGLPNFDTKLYNNNYISDSDGTIQFAQGNEIESSDQVIAMYMKDVSLPTSFRFSQSGDYGIGAANDYWHIIRLKDMTVPAYNGDWERTDFPSVERHSCGVAVFVKSQDNTALDKIRQGLSYGGMKGFDSLTMIDTYFRSYSMSLSNPIKPLVSMRIPEAIFKSLDLTRPVRIKTDTFNMKFVISKITAYKDSVTPVDFELIKIS